MHPAACEISSLSLSLFDCPQVPQMITSTLCLSATTPLTSLMRSKQTNVCLPLPRFPFTLLSHRTGVNVSFIDVNTTDWASISGVAKVHNDKKLIESLWSPLCVTHFFPSTSHSFWPLAASQGTSPTLKMVSTRVTKTTPASRLSKSFRMRYLGATQPLNLGSHASLIF